MAKKPKWIEGQCIVLKWSERLQRYTKAKLVKLEPHQDLSDAMWNANTGECADIVISVPHPSTCPEF